MAARIPRYPFRPSIGLRTQLLSSPIRRLQSSSTAAATATAATAATETVAHTVAPVARAAKKTTRFGKRLIKSIFYLTTAAAGLYYLTDTRASVHRYFSIPLARLFFPDAEDSHHAAIDAIRSLYQLGLHPRERPDLSPNSVSLEVSVFGDNKLENPMGISAGLDKDGEIPDPLFDLGAAVVEIGGITPEPQEGNPRPRVFRLPSQDAAINRYGLNSEGAERVAKRLEDRVKTYAARLGWSGPEGVQAVLDGQAGVPPGSLRPGKILGIQIAKNKNTPEEDIEAVCRDYVACVEKLGPYADVLVVNVSSPNTPGLRALQDTRPLTELLSAVVAAAQAVPRKNKPAVMVKVSPDEDTPEQITGVCDAMYLSRVDGVIVGNTTKTRPKSSDITSRDAAVLHESGGYSGPLTFPHTLQLIKDYRRILDETPLRLAIEQARAASLEKARQELPPDTYDSEIANSSEYSDLLSKIDVKDLDSSSPFVQQEKVIFASGGISNGNDVLEALNAGASVCMMYTALTSNGLGHVTTVKRQIRDKIKPMPKP